MNRLIFLAIPLLAACSAGDGDARESSRVPYATQLTAPSPDYAAMDFTPPEFPAVEMERKASAPLPGDARQVGELWAKRLSDAGHIFGMGLNGQSPDGAIVSMDILLTAEEFDSWVEAQGGGFPRHIDLRFQNPLHVPQVSEEAAGQIRIWPASERRTGAQNMAALGGRIVLDDGCFYFIDRGEPAATRDKLAWFLNETGIDVDDQGYLVLVNRNTGELEARIGEEMGWAGPNGVVITDAQKAALVEACGDREIVSVGNPQASEKTYVTYPHLRPQRIVPRAGEPAPPAPPADYPPPAPPAPAPAPATEG